MKVTLLIILGFAILAVSLAVKGKKKSPDLENPTSNKPETESDAEKSGGETSESDKSSGKNKKSPNAKQNADKSQNKDDDSDTPEAPKSKKGSKSTPTDSPKANKGTKPAPSKQPKKATESAADANGDEDITIDADDILKDDEEEDENDEVVIPAPDDLDTETDPLELAEKIRNVTDKEKRKELIDKLRSAKDENKDIIPQGKFYAAAFAALNPKNIKRAETFWKNQLKRAISKAENTGGKIKAGLGNALGNAQKFAQADPIGIALRRGEAVLLTTISDTLKNVGKVSDLGHDVVGNLSRLVRAATFPVDFIPFVKDIKNNVHNLIEEQAERGKFLSGSFAENGSQAFANAAKDADRKADQRETLMKKQFSSKRNLL